jgi:hypothetical protein
MRSDMYKVIVERPRSGKGNYFAAARRRDDFEGPRQLGMRAGYGGPWLNENLRPLERFLIAQVGRPWNKVYGEISAGIDRRNTVQQHIFAHLDDMIATQVEWRDGRWLDLKYPSRGFFDHGDLRQPLYVDPRTELIRANKQYRARRAERHLRAAKEAADIAARRRVIDGTTLLLLIEAEWYEVRLAPLPPQSDPVYDAVLRCVVQRKRADHIDQQRYFYGGGCFGRDARQVYAVSKRQLSRREIELHGLSRKGSS